MKKSIFSTQSAQNRSELAEFYKKMSFEKKLPWATGDKGRQPHVFAIFGLGRSKKKVEKIEKKWNLKLESHAEQWKTRVPMIRYCLRLREQDLIMG